MRYNIKRWYPTDKDKDVVIRLEDCERLEVVKQLIKSIDIEQNFEAIVSRPEEL